MGALEISIVVAVFLSFLLLGYQSRKRKQSVVNIKNINRAKSRSSVQKKVPAVSSGSAKAIEIKLFSNENLIVPESYADFKLLDLAQLSPVLVAEVTGCMRQPNPLLLQLSSRDYAARELYELIKSDPEMSALILKEVNSARFALDKAITSVNHAIAFLGAEKVKDIVIQCCVSHCGFSDEGQRKAYDNLWAASHIASSIAHIIAVHMGQDAPAKMSTICLLSYLGDQAIVTAFPEAAKIYANDEISFYERVDVIQTQYKVNRAAIAQALVAQWDLPAELVGKVGGILQLLPPQGEQVDIAENLEQNIICYLACAIAERIVFGRIASIELLLPNAGAAHQELAFKNVGLAIEQCSAQRLNELLCSKTFRLQMNKLIDRARLQSGG